MNWTGMKYNFPNRVIYTWDFLKRSSVVDCRIGLIMIDEEINKIANIVKDDVKLELVNHAEIGYAFDYHKQLYCMRLLFVDKQQRNKYIEKRNVHIIQRKDFELLLKLYG